MKRNLIYFIILVFLAFSFNTIAAESHNDTIKSTVKKGKKRPFKKIKAYFRYRDADYNGALRIYREILENDKDDAKLDFLIGKCDVALQSMEQAISFLQSAKKAKS